MGGVVGDYGGLWDWGIEGGVVGIKVSRGLWDWGGCGIGGGVVGIKVSRALWDCGGLWD